MPSLEVIFGTYPIAENTPEDRQRYIDLLRQHNVKSIDTARIYPGSEEALGQLNVADDFILSTKAIGFREGAQSKEGIIRSANESLNLLKTDQVDTYFLHSPDPAIPIEETLEGIQALFKQGKFKRWGVSNFTFEDTVRIYNLARSKGYVLPSVYQGNYNPVARKSEKDLIPTLRQLGMSFWAYSPLAGGFLVRTAAEVTGKAESTRFGRNDNVGKMYQKLYNRPTLLQALDKWEDLAKKAGTSKSGLAYRWVTFNAPLRADLGDCILLGATRPSQLEQTLNSLDEGPLPEDIVKAIDDIWELVKDEAPADNFNL